MVNGWRLFSQVIGGGCPLCRAPGDTICRACLEGLPRNRYACPRCAVPMPQELGPAVLCGECLSQAPAFDRALAPLLYQSPIDDLMAGFKYHHRLHWGRMLGDLLADHLACKIQRFPAAGGDTPAPTGRTRRSRFDAVSTAPSPPSAECAPPQLLLPVPATPARLRERGFNQAAELARRLAVRLGIPWQTGRLLRTREADHQRGLSAPQRRRNMRGAFACRGRLPARVALIDDVITTGATARAASAALKGAGVEWVEVWAVARTPKGDCA